VYDILIAHMNKEMAMHATLFDKHETLFDKQTQMNLDMSKNLGEILGLVKGSALARAGNIPSRVSDTP
jgi:hypothetical protein